MKKKSFGKQLWNHWCDVVFPTLSCGGCGEKTSETYVGICDFCVEAMVEARMNHEFCSRCGSFYASQFMSCPSCFQDTRHRYYSKVQSFCIYDEVSAPLVKAFKFHRALYLAEPMAKLMAGFLDIDEDGRFDSIVPVPLHRRRYRERGYNQSLLLAKALVEFRSLAVASDILVKVKDTPSQTTLSGLQRRNALRGAYDVTEQGREAVEGRRLILLDDVITTGATAIECAKVLKHYGAKEIKVVTFAAGSRKFDGNFNGTLS